MSEIFNNSKKVLGAMALATALEACAVPPVENIKAIDTKQPVIEAPKPEAPRVLEEKVRRLERSFKFLEVTTEGTSQLQFTTASGEICIVKKPDEITTTGEYTIQGGSGAIQPKFILNSTPVSAETFYYYLSLSGGQQTTNNDGRLQFTNTFPGDTIGTPPGATIIGTIEKGVCTITQAQSQFTGIIGGFVSTDTEYLISLNEGTMVKTISLPKLPPEVKAD
jgi:hypothetical protein